MNRKALLITSFIAIIAISFVIIIYLLHTSSVVSLRAPESVIRNQLLKITPLGMRVGECRIVLSERTKFKESGIANSSGSIKTINSDLSTVRRPENYPGEYSGPLLHLKGEKLFLGWYFDIGSFGGVTNVYGLWEFDGDNLKDISVTKGGTAAIP